MRTPCDLPLLRPSSVKNLPPNGGRTLPWLASAIILTACHSGPPALDQTVQPGEQQAYRQQVAAHDGNLASAWLAWRSEETGQSVESLSHLDEQLPEDRNPFDSTDAWAVRRGALVFQAACVQCHGVAANGVGPNGESLMGIKDFSSPEMRSAIALDPGRPAKWYPKVANGSASGRVMPDGTPADMPAMRDRLTREQIWLALTWLASDASMAEEVSK